MDDAADEPSRAASTVRGRVAVVTDSTSCLPADLLSRYAVRVVPLRVTVGAQSLTDGVDVSAADVAQALRAKVSVSTSRPTPAEFVDVYATLLAEGATHVVSIHLSAALSGTWESAVLASQEFGYGQVRVVDSRSTAMALGFTVLAAAERAADGGTAAQVQGVAAGTVDQTSTMFYVDTLEYLRRGGRIGTAASLLATTLAVKPLLQLVEGQIVPLEKVRTSSRALSRLAELAAAAAGRAPVDIAVHHLDAAERAESVAGRLGQLVPSVRALTISELGPVIGAHLGPGVIGVVLSRHGPS